MIMKKLATSAAALSFAIGVTACSPSNTSDVESDAPQPEEATEVANYPATKFDLTHWSLTLPVDADNDGAGDIIEPHELQTYSHPDYFYLDDQNRMVFMSANVAATEVTSTNTRSEFRYESRGADTSIAESDPLNNWALAAKDDADQFAAIGGKMEATLHVDHVSLNAGYPDKEPAYSTVVGQIHAYQFPNQDHGYGWGNEPLKISYKKWPDHEYGSVFWQYERNLDFDDPNRIDIDYLVWGTPWTSDADPGQSGIALGEEFSYSVNVHQNTMYLTFETERHETVTHQIDLSNNLDVYGNVDELDHPNGYTGDYLYFKAGNYNQCSSKDAPTFRYPACPGTGDLATDVRAGNYSQATFSKLVVSDATPQ